MKKLISILLVLSLAIGITAVQAAENCDGGTVVSLKGQIDNNAVTTQYPNGLGQYTLGVADLVFKYKAKSVKLNCAVLGEPTGSSTPNDGHQYDHMLVCDDGQQSEFTFKTWLVAKDTVMTNVLDSEEIADFCHPQNAVFAFKELAEVNGERLTKGLFQGASGTVTVVGCVNWMGSSAEVNMGVKGELCLPNW